MAYCTCPRNCTTFREHVGNGPMISAKATPSRGRVAQLEQLNSQWVKDGEAYHRLAQNGYELPQLDGAAEIEAKASTPIELKLGKVLGDEAPLYEKVATECFPNGIDVPA